jgi:two-component system, cell cycle sensor histidine kinase and response regulator CckA
MLQDHHIDHADQQLNPLPTTDLVTAIYKILTQSHDLADMLQQCAAAFCQWLPIAYSQIWLYEAQTANPVLQASAGRIADPNHLIDQAAILPAALVATEQPILLNDPNSTAHFADSTWLSHAGIVALLAYPLRHPERLIGTLVLLARQPLAATTPASLAPLANNIALAVVYRQSERALEQALHSLRPAHPPARPLEARPGAALIPNIVKRKRHDDPGQTVKPSATARDISQRKTAEQALRESETRFRNMADHAPVMIWVADPTGYCTYLNQRWCEFTGTLLSQNLGFGWLTSVHPDDRARTIVDFEQANQEQSAFSLEYRLRRADGEYRWVIDSAAPRFDFEGRFQGYIGSVIDMTERRRSEEELREREAMLRSVGDNLPNGFLYQLVTDPAENRRFTYVSAGVERATGGLRAEEILRNGNLLFDQLPVADQQRIDAANRLAIQQMGIFDLEFRRQLPSGELRWVHARSAPHRRLEDGSILWHGLELDVTDRKLAEEALEASHHRYQALFKAANVGIALTDNQGFLLEVNQAFATMLGYTPAELIGRYFLELTHPDERAEELRRVDQALAQLGDSTYPWFEKRYLHRNGSVVWVRLATELLRDSNGQPWLMSAVVQDITEVKLLEDQVRQAQKLEAIGRLAGGLAHDFNNLLTVINGYSDLILRRLHPEDPIHDKVAQIRAAGERAATLTRQLLTFSRKQVIQPTVVQLNHLVSNLERMFSRLIGEHIQLTTILEPQLWPLKADPGQIEQVIMNLIVNARDAMPTGGRLTITTANTYLTPEAVQRYPALTPGPHILLTVSDTGHGMDEATRRRLFEPFFTTKAPGQGTGLGLATVYGIVQQSGGAIDVYSEVGRGAIFKILLPKTTVEEVATSDEPAPLPRPLTGNETILLVEDEAQIRQLALTTLQSSGYTVLEAADGDAALRLSDAHAGRIDLLVSDVIMPGLSGPQLSTRLVLLRPGLKVLFVSGYTDAEITPHGELDAELAFLPKPYTPDQLQMRVREILDRGIGGLGDWVPGS